VGPPSHARTLPAAGSPRPFGTEDIYKIYAESFRDEANLQVLLKEAQQVVDKAIT
jgi:phosphoglucomutase